MQSPSAPAAMPAALADAPAVPKLSPAPQAKSAPKPASPAELTEKRIAEDDLLPGSLEPPGDGADPSLPPPASLPAVDPSVKAPRPVAAREKTAMGKTGAPEEDLLPVGVGGADMLDGDDDLLPVAASGASASGAKLQAVMREVPLPTMSDNLTKKIVNPEFTMREPTTKTIKVHGQEIELRVLSPEEKARRRLRRNMMVVTFCFVVILILLWWTGFRSSPIDGPVRSLFDWFDFSD